MYTAPAVCMWVFCVGCLKFCFVILQGCYAGRETVENVGGSVECTVWQLVYGEDAYMWC